jgi:hypothetical protein
VLRAALVAAAVSGLPSTAHALATGRDPIAATVAAGSLLLPHESRRPVLVAAAVPVHLSVSLAWTVVLALLPARRRSPWWGAAAGLAIAAIDLGLIGRRAARIRALPLLPQLADHAVFGVVVAWCLELRVRARA